MRFEDLHLIAPLVRAVHDEGYVEPTPVQEHSIPHVLAGKDLLSCAQTGTGKTAAFALPILQRLHAHAVQGHRHVRVLVLAPTRELATQIGESFRVYGKHLPFRGVVIYGGVGQTPQTDALRKGVDIVVATPGRLLDLMQQGYAKLGHVEIAVLDEADRMLDMGFIHDVRRIMEAVPRKRQTLFFSATLPHDIRTLARDILTDPVRVDITPTATTVEKIAQSVYFVSKASKFGLLENMLRDPSFRKSLVFTRTKHGADKVMKQLNRAGVRADAIHGNKGQGARERSLEDFRKGKTRVLVATDIAARGIDVEDISHVFNFDIPHESENYVHRIGRTARAGATGSAISFCAPEEREDLLGIERLIRMKIPVKQSSVPYVRAEEQRHPPAASGLRRAGGGHGHGHAGGHGHHAAKHGHAQEPRQDHGHSRGREEAPRHGDGHSREHRPAHGHGHAQGHAQGQGHGHSHAQGQGHGHGHGQAHGHGPSHAHGGNRTLRGRHPRRRR